MEMKPKYKIYVLSLMDEIQRRSDIFNQLSNQNLRFEFIDAIDLRNTSEDDIKVYRESIVINSKRELKKSELGCLLGHKYICNKIINDNIDFAVVLEDDAVIDTDFNKFLDTICYENKLLNAFDVLLLGYSKLLKKDEQRFYIKEPIKILLRVRNRSVGKVWRNWTSGTVAYIITQQGAMKMASLDSYGLADDWGLYSSKGINILHLRPLIVFEQFYKYDSSIEGERKNFKIDSWSFKEVLRVIRGGLQYIALKARK